MVSNMNTLIKLWFLKTKGTIRNLMKKPSSAIFTVAVVLLYGFIFVSLFLYRDQSPMVITTSLHSSILIMIAFLAFLLFSTLMSSKKALFYGEDAYFLFSGPFTRKQIMSYLALQTIFQSIMLGFFAMIFFAGMSTGLSFDGMFIVLMFFGIVLSVILFLVLTDYIYVLSIGDQKYKRFSKLIPAGFIVCVLIILVLTYLQTGTIKTIMVDFIQSPLFYCVPVFGWLKLSLVSYVAGDVLMCILGFGLIVLGLIIVYTLFIHYQGDFYEQALADSLDFSKRIKEAKAGNQDALRSTKVKSNVKSEFKVGAFAVLSKNLLLMKKTNRFITLSDVISIAIYILVTIFSDLGMGIFVYMMIMYVFSSLQQSELYNELQNYHIYLIPDKPIKKLIAIMIPTFIKVSSVTAISFIIVGIYYQEGVIMIINYLINMLGYISVFMSASVLSIRFLKSRSSRIFENIMRMLIMFVCSIPSVILTIYVVMSGHATPTTLLFVSYSSLVMNFVISAAIIYFCRDMMNGRELKSE